MILYTEKSTLKDFLFKSFKSLDRNIKSEENSAVIQLQIL
jgi:hypothetical protein